MPVPVRLGSVSAIAGAAGLIAGAMLHPLLSLDMPGLVVT